MAGRGKSGTEVERGLTPHDRSQEAQIFLLRPAEVAWLLGLNRNTIYKWLCQGILTRIRLGGATWINGYELLDRLLGGCARPASADPDVRARARALRKELRAREKRSSDRRVP